MIELCGCLCEAVIFDSWHKNDSWSEVSTLIIEFLFLFLEQNQNKDTFSGTELKDKKVAPKWYMEPKGKGDNIRVYH